MVKFTSIFISVVFGLLLLIVLLNGLKNAMTTGGVVIGCEVSCSTNADCDDENNCTNDVCMYPKSCESICYHSLRDDCR